MNLLALGLFGTLLFLLHQPTESEYLSDISDVEEPSTSIGVAGNAFSIMRKKKKRIVQQNPKRIVQQNPKRIVQ